MKNLKKSVTTKGFWKKIKVQFEQRRLDNGLMIYVTQILFHKMRHLPGRCHELLHDRAGQLSLDLDHPYRLIFEPAHDPIPLLLNTKIL